MPSAFTRLILRLPGFLLALSVHEYAHARMAYNLGDDTAELSGRMTLEPWVHVDIVGALMLLKLLGLDGPGLYLLIHTGCEIPERIWPKSPLQARLPIL